MPIKVLDEITYPFWDLSYTMLGKGATEHQQLNIQYTRTLKHLYVFCWYETQLSTLYQRPDLANKVNILTVFFKP